MLTELQRQIAAIVAELDEAQGFVLAGGGALIIHGAIDRQTRDLDYFSTEPSASTRYFPLFRERSVTQDSSPHWAKRWIRLLPSVPSTVRPAMLLAHGARDLSD